jgi:RNA polymerase sigma-70 factor (ECF subfamily)
MTGSVHEAEDLVQETYLRAWRAFDRFEQRSSVRTWMYRIATNVCLTALDRRRRRPLPSGLGAPSDNPYRASIPAPADVSWLEPIPDHLVVDELGDPAEVVAMRHSVRLALVAGLQLLPPRQRAALILCDVLAWPAADVAELLDVSTVAVKSLLQRARIRLVEVPPVDVDLAEPTDDGARRVLDRYVKAFERCLRAVRRRRDRAPVVRRCGARDDRIHDLVFRQGDVRAVHRRAGHRARLRLADRAHPCQRPAGRRGLSPSR